MRLREKVLVGALTTSLLVNHTLIQERVNVLEKESLAWSKLSRKDLLDIYAKVYKVNLSNKSSGKKNLTKPQALAAILTGVVVTKTASDVMCNKLK